MWTYKVSRLIHFFSYIVFSVALQSRGLNQTLDEVENDDALLVKSFKVHKGAKYAYRPKRGVDFTGIKDARTVQEAKDQFEERLKRVFQFWSIAHMSRFPKSDKDRGKFVNAALGRIKLGIDGEKINSYILNPDAKQFAEYGSTFLAVRNGDYDFTSNILATLIYADLANHKLLKPETLQKLKLELLPSGSEIITHFQLNNGPIYEDTENHILMINVSKYLNNQLMMMDLSTRSNEYDNAENGFNEWFLFHLQTFFKHGFFEYNSRPYQKYTLFALNNLAGFAQDPAVKLAATMLLDLLSATYAIQSNYGRRLPPFRRTEKYSTKTRALAGDAESARFALLSGNFASLRYDSRFASRNSPMYGDDVEGKAFSDHGVIGEYPALKQISIRTGDVVFQIRSVLSNGKTYIRKHGIDEGNSKSLLLQNEEYVNYMEFHFDRIEGMTNDVLSYIKLSTSNGNILEGGKKTSTIHQVSAAEGFQMYGFHGRISQDRITMIGALSIPIDYLYEDEELLLDYGTDSALHAGLVDYRVPDTIQDLIIREDHHTFFQTFKHTAVELYYSSKSYLISGGGIFEETPMFGAASQHGWAMPTVIIPSHDPSTDYRNWIRIEGHKKRQKRYNHAITNNFASGSNIFVPEYIPYECRDYAEENWLFINFHSDICSLGYEFYVALYISDCDSDACSRQGSNWGFFETREADDVEFSVFKNDILQFNSGEEFKSDKLNKYHTSNGGSIEFDGIQEKQWIWGISSINGIDQNRNIENWPFASGDIINDDGKGFISIVNPYLKVGIYLNMRKPLHPYRLEVDYVESVNKLYRTFFGHDGSVECERLVNRLFSNDDRLTLNGIAKLLFQSDEFQNKPSKEKIISVYEIMLNVVPSLSEINEWDIQIENKRATLHRIATVLVESERFKSTSFEHQMYVTDILGAPDIFWIIPKHFLIISDSNRTKIGIELQTNPSDDNKLQESDEKKFDLPPSNNNKKNSASLNRITWLAMTVVLTNCIWIAS